MAQRYELNDRQWAAIELPEAREEGASVSKLGPPRINLVPQAIRASSLAVDSAHSGGLLLVEAAGIKAAAILGYRHPGIWGGQ
jgi:hypothetical protein